MNNIRSITHILGDKGYVNKKSAGKEGPPVCRVRQARGSIHWKH